MKTTFTMLALFVTTAAAVATYPQYQGNAGTTPVAADPPDDRGAAGVEVVFVLDTTSSMSGMIQTAKEKIWSIASSMASARQAPEVRMGLVAFRDRGDAYVTRVVDLSADLDTMYGTLMEFRAEGGGDAPESVNLALREAVEKISWSQDPATYRVVFLVGDSPPHMDYQEEMQYPDILAMAARKGIVVNAIRCGPNPRTAEQWQNIARLGGGRYFSVEQSGGAVAISTPYDGELAELSRQLDDTRLYYGAAEEKARMEKKVEATGRLHALSSVESRARRAAFNATESGRSNLLGEGELVDDVVSGRVDLSAIDPDQLPAPLKAMSPGEQASFVGDAARKRKELERGIRDLADRRQSYLRDKLDAAGGAEASLDEKIYRAVREQATKSGLSYQERSSAY